MSEALKLRRVVCAAVFLLSGFLPSGCGPRAHFELDKQPKVVVLGGTVPIGLTALNPPQSTRYHWYSDQGACDPQETDSPWTKYTAPSERSGDFRVTVQVKNGDDTLFTDGVSVKVIRPEEESTGAIPTPSQTAAGSPATEGGAAIKINVVPTYDPVGGPSASEEIAGQVSGVDPQSHRVVVYAWTDGWYVQPLIVTPLTDIEPDGSWSTQSHLGSRYAALLVKSTFRPRNVTLTLPVVGGDVLAVTIASGRR